MLEKYIMVGNGLELQSIHRAARKSGEEKNVYKSRIHDIISDDRIEVTMPLEKTKLILLPVGGEFELIFYTKSGLLQCFGKVVDRYKSDNLYILAIDITSNLKKHQRREYYRYNCSLELLQRALEPEEIIAFESKESFPQGEEPELFSKGIMVDVSGGGTRFICTNEYEPGSYVLCKFSIPVVYKLKEFTLLSKVLFKRKVDNPELIFEHRVQFVRIGNEEREEIIKYIFEEERRNRKKEQG